MQNLKHVILTLTLTLGAAGAAVANPALPNFKAADHNGDGSA